MQLVMAIDAKVVIALAVACLLAGGAQPTAAALTCGQVVQHVVPCVDYARNKGPLTTECCNGLKTLNAMASSTPDRQAACFCLKKTAASYSGLNFGLIAGMPAKCGVNIPYAISPSTDCSKVK